MITGSNLEEHYNKNSGVVFKNPTYSVNKYNDVWHLFIMSTSEDGKINNRLFSFKPRFRKRVVKIANNVNNCENKKYIDEDVISFITKCSVGTVHGFVDIYLSIIHYLKNIDKYKDYKILVYKNSCQGIFDIIYHLCHMNVLDRNKIIYIEEKIVYKFRSICQYMADCEFQKSRISKYYHTEDNFFKEIKLFIDKYFIYKWNYLNPINYYIENVAIIKEISSKSSVSGWNDGFNINDINLFCKKYNYTLVKPESMNEVTLINILNNCKNFVASWGTAHHKNIVYLSENCKNINIFVKKNSRYLSEYLEFYLKEYNEYLDSDRTNDRNECLKKFYDSPRVKYHKIKVLKNIVL